MIFYKEYLACLVDPFKSVSTISIHVSISIRNASVGEQNCDLMNCLRQVLPKSKDHIQVSNISDWASLLCVDIVWEFHWIVDEEKWSIVSNYIVVSFLSVKLNSKTSWVSYCISSSSLSTNG